jgi:putative transposase
MPWKTREVHIYTATFRAMLLVCGVKCLRLPARRPNLNAYAERFALSIKSECFDRVIPLNEAHLRRCVREYVAHDHEERPHQQFSNRHIKPLVDEPESTAPVQRRERLGGILNHYPLGLTCQPVELDTREGPRARWIRRMRQ